jgi:hypothetical protein
VVCTFAPVISVQPPPESVRGQGPATYIWGATQAYIWEPAGQPAPNSMHCDRTPFVTQSQTFPPPGLLLVELPQPMTEMNTNNREISFGIGLSLSIRFRFVSDMAGKVPFILLCGTWVETALPPSCPNFPNATTTGSGRC